MDPIVTYKDLRSALASAHDDVVVADQARASATAVATAARERYEGIKNSMKALEDGFEPVRQLLKDEAKAAEPVNPV